jgi:very-short-patch-repair endonuclease
MRFNQIHNRENHLETRRILRKNQTPEEKILWDELRNRKLANLKFNRQHSIDGYIVDFYCAEKKLIVELDGAQHFTTEGRLYDQERDRHLASLGNSILRFPNGEIKNDLFSVLDSIRKIAS